LGDLAGVAAARGLRPLLDAGRLLQEEADRRRLHPEGEGLVLVVGDLDRDRGTLLHVLALRVERLAEFHDVDAALAERGADRRRRVRRACRHLQFQIARDLLCHLCLLDLAVAGRWCRGPGRTPWRGILAFHSAKVRPSRPVRYSSSPPFRICANWLSFRMSVSPTSQRTVEVRPAVLKSSLPARIPVRPGSPGRRSTPPPSAAPAL